MRTSRTEVWPQLAMLPESGIRLPGAHIELRNSGDRGSSACTEVAHYDRFIGKKRMPPIHHTSAYQQFAVLPL